MDEIERERRLLELLSEALEITGDARQRLLDKAGAEDPCLREELESMLSEEAKIGLLDVSAVANLADSPMIALNKEVTFDELVAQRSRLARIGPYRVIGVLGRGGMGTVYLGEQEEPVRRRVALKVISAIHDLTQRQRFAAECQALARLNHPNVASLYEVGTTEDEYPFVAMELVEGTSITTWCHEHKLRLHERIELFIGVCAGVRHAHEKGILHRDIKPTNVLVQETDGQPVAKVIDFGIARVFDEPLLAGTRLTLDHHLLGSPAYMSPEIAAGGRDDVDTRGDVYSLGLLLYELLVDVAPFEVENQSLINLLNQHAKGGFETPSSRFAGLPAEQRKEIADRRMLSEEELPRQIRGVLDAIVIKAIARDREQRYSSPADLAADLERHLRHVPVVAMPPSAAYRTRLFIKRHQPGVIAAALVVMALVLATVGTSLALLRARRAEVQALENFAQARQAVDDFLTSVSENDLLEAPGAQPLRRQLLERALAYYEGFIEEHRDDTSVLFELAQAYLRVGRINDDLGTHQHALPAYEKAMAILHPLAAEDPDQGEYRYHLADATHRASWAYYETGQARKSFVVGIEAVKMEEELVEDFPRETRYRELLAKGLTDSAEGLEFIGQDEAALENARRALGILQRLDEETSESGGYGAKLALAHTRFGSFLYRVERFDEGLETHQAALEIYRRLLRDDPADRTNRARYAKGLSRYGETHLGIGNLDEAREAFGEALELWRTLRQEYPSLQAYQYNHSFDLKNLGRAHRTAGAFTQAVDSSLEAVHLMRGLRARNPSSLSYHLQTGHQLRELGEIYLHAGQTAQAINTSNEAVEVLGDYLAKNPTGEDAKHSLSKALGSLAASLHDSGRSQEALEAKERQLSILHETRGDSRFEAVLRIERAAVSKVLAKWYHLAGDAEAALATLEGVLAALDEKAPDATRQELEDQLREFSRRSN